MSTDGHHIVTPVNLGIGVVFGSVTVYHPPCGALRGTPTITYTGTPKPSNSHR